MFSSVTNRVSVLSPAVIGDIPSVRRDSVKSEIDNYTRDKHVMVFSGFSGLGYSDSASLKAQLSSALDEAINRYGAHHLCVVAGATPEGIGAVYELAKNKGVGTLGIVSEHARGGVAQDCDRVIFVNDPGASWKVLDETGASYMVYVATKQNGLSRTGEFLAYGGGVVTLSELQEAKSMEIPLTIHPEFEPDPLNAAAKLQKAPGEDLTPVRSAFLSGV
ncbi:hypothetical protein [Pluralibacter sp.]|jgi:hypothetical protein|uniref:hypothetical protein n=1 Tax=Pluralibacter sp. TaxID=1920032 RepID=UPI0025D8DB65|nr:hypothetical protein [Pluralibacter sp.]MBV8045276.1 hypothetical protein [Pluralibacter sp.]